MAVVTMRELLDSGVHFGHQTRRWNPKMKRFIFTERNGIYIIDIQQSLTVYKRIQRLKELEALETANDLLLTKKELLVLRREREKLFKNLDGIRHMTKLPSAIWVVDTKKEHLAVQEAKKLGIPVIAILDTNCDPDEVDFKIPGNDDAIRSIELLTRVITDAIAEGLKARSAAAPAPVATAEAAAAEALEKEILAAAPAATDASVEAYVNWLTIQQKM
ncbi:MAG: 30S ribosomal protein S2 [Actinobacteria bacterium]|nr:30S ribosomal protein S2 [Actinomycetota bacterium]